MLPSLKSEFRKLLSVRSTYLLITISLLLTVFISFWVFGFKDDNKAAINPTALTNVILATVSVASLFMSFLAVLLVGHEYRYNLIMYTLTGIRRRSDVFVAKLLAVNTVSLVVVSLLAVASIGLFSLGQNAAHINTVTQTVAATEVFWKSLVTILGSVTFAFIVTILLRNLIGAIVLVLVMPTTIEPLIGLLIKENAKYLPYTALNDLTSMSDKVSYGFSIGVVTVYALIGIIVAYVSFLQRDAS